LEGISSTAEAGFTRRKAIEQLLMNENRKRTGRSLDCCDNIAVPGFDPSSLARYGL
jgi:hypothetical protein